MITERRLTESEIDELIKEMRHFPDVGLYTKNQWKGFKHIFIADENNHLIGVCVVIQLNKWVKIGPVIILKNYQGKGYGKEVLKFVTEKYKDNNIYIGSSNQRVQMIMESLKFRKVSNFLNLSTEIKLYLIKHFFSRINWDFMVDSIPKLFKKSGKYIYLVKYTTNYEISS